MADGIWPHAVTALGSATPAAKAPRLDSSYAVLKSRSFTVATAFGFPLHFLNLRHVATAFWLSLLRITALQSG